MTVTNVLIAVAAVVWVMGRRLAGSQVEVKKLAVLPLVLCGIGLSELTKVHHPDARGVALLVVSGVVGVALGAVRGRSVHLGEKDGALWMRYTPATVGLWVASIAAKVVLVPFEHGSAVASHGLLLSLGVGILAESAVVLLRAARTGSAVVWEIAKDGAPAQRSDRFEQARTWLASRETTRSW